MTGFFFLKVQVNIDHIKLLLLHGCHFIIKMSISLSQGIDIFYYVSKEIAFKQNVSHIWQSTFPSLVES